ncbi:MAG TPA: LamG-like jellyroll fold domain-containing protein [Azospirillum sp.]|nr:LamG-like jellyroll fold domain-containing protein [Azospirillum sp.]
MRVWRLVDLAALGYAALLAAILAFPFRLELPAARTNGVVLPPGADAAVFAAPGLIRADPAPGGLARRIAGAGALTVELWAASADGGQRGPARLLAYSAGPNVHNLVVGQDKDALVVRLRTSATDPRGHGPELRAPGVFHDTARRHLVFTYDGVRRVLYVDGVRHTQADGPGGSLAAWDAGQGLAFGNEVSGNRPWRGALWAVALFDRALDGREVKARFDAGPGAGADDDGVGGVDGALLAVDFAAGTDGLRTRLPGEAVRLTAPASYPVRSGKKLLSLDRFNVLMPGQTVRDWIDLAGNLAAFAPLGFLLTLALRRRGLAGWRWGVAVLAAGAAFSLALEALQVVIVHRDSSVADVLANGVSTGAGVLAAVRVTPWLPVPPAGRRRRRGRASGA